MDPTDPTDVDLLRAFTNGDANGFARLRDRYLSMVYAAAVRQTLDAHQAEDVAQAVFLLLARRAETLAQRETTVAGWLLLTTRHVARNVRRAELRIKQREQKAAAMRQESIPPAMEPKQLSTVIDRAMAELKDTDRDVLAERYFRERSVAQVATAMHINESAAGKRIARALDRLRKALGKLGITTTDAALALSLPIAVAPAQAPATVGGTPSRPAIKLARAAVRSAWVSTLAGTAGILVLIAVAVVVAIHNAPAQVPSANVAATINLPQTNRSVTLRLEDPKTHKPIPNATVTLADGGGRMPPAPAASDGTYTFELPQPLIYVRAICRAPGRVPMEMTFGAGTFQGARPPQYIIRMEPGMRIGGLVTDDIGNPLPDATVHISNAVVQGPKDKPQLYLSAHVTTDLNGNWHFDLAPASLQPVIIEPRYGQARWASPHYPLPTQELRDGTFVQRLDEPSGRSFSGTVTDQQGKPIEGAVVVFASGRYEQSKPAARTNATGQFHVVGVNGDTIATVQANGYGPQQQNIGRNSPSVLHFKLPAPATLSGTVVDAAGTPISGVKVEVENWNFNNALTWSTQTNYAGEFKWRNAPTNELQVDAWCSNFVLIRNAQVKAGQPNRLVMYRPVQITGTVTDADTHRPIPKFNITYGIPLAGSKVVTWQPQSQQTLIDGRYTASITDFSNGGKIRIEVKGYRPAVSRLIMGDEGKITLNFALHKGSGPSGVVLAPNGKPLANTQVIGVPAGRVLSFGPNARGNLDLDLLDEQPYLKLARTDAIGAFEMPALGVTPGHYHLVVEAPQGLVVCDATTFTTAGEKLHLHQWGVLHGVFRRNGKPAAGAAVSLGATWNRGQEFMYFGCRSTTAVNGRFVFDKVPPGVRCRLGELVPATPQLISLVTIGWVTVGANQTVAKTFGGDGRPVEGRITLPPGMPSDAEVDISCSTEGAASTRRSTSGPSSPAVEFVAFPDHTFHADDVLPGRYRLQVNVSSLVEGAHSWSQRKLASGTTEFSVPANPPCPNDIPVKLGAIQTHRVNK